MHEAQKAQHETEAKLSNLKIELNGVSQENKILRKKLEEARNQPDQSTPTSPILSPTLSPTPSLTPSQTPDSDLNKAIKVHDVTIKTISKRKRSGF